METVGVESSSEDILAYYFMCIDYILNLEIKLTLNNFSSTPLF